MHKQFEANFEQITSEQIIFITLDLNNEKQFLYGQYPWAFEVA